MRAWPVGEKNVKVFYTNIIEEPGAVRVHYYDVFYSDYDDGLFLDEDVGKSPSCSTLLFITNADLYEDINR